MSATISIITPCYNGARFLGDTIESVRAQASPVVEHLVIDDGSTDCSASIAEAYGDPVRVIRQTNRGESAARNRGIAEARGDFLLFLDADDLLEPFATARLLEAASQSPESVGLMGFRFLDDNSGHRGPPILPAAAGFFPDIIGGNLGPPHCWLTPRRLIERAGGFDEAVQWFEDWDLWWRVGLTGAALVTVPVAGAVYRQHAQSQLATTKMRDRTWGHATLMGRLSSRLVAEQRLLDAHGDALFWAGWAAVLRARTYGVPWAEIGELTGNLQTVAAHGPDRLRRGRTARLVRSLGLRAVATPSIWLGRGR